MSKNKDLTVLLFPFILIAVFLIKFPQLSLPHFWDEAWSYSPAVQYMYENHVSLLPGSIPPELSKGHPLLFFFLSASWMKIAGPSLFSKHSFALLVSLLYLSSIFYIVRRLFSGRVALIAALLTAFQAVFLAQSSMLLPEIMLAFFTLWTLYFYISKKKLLFLISGSLMILTKETGVFMLILIFLWDLISFLCRENSKKENQGYEPRGNPRPRVPEQAGRNSAGEIKKQIGTSLLLAAPFLVFGLHLIAQKHSFGWFFYPEHISLITGFHEGLIQMGFYAEHFFLDHAQIYIVVTLLTAFILHFFVKEKIPRDQKKTLWMVFLFTAFYFLASSFLFFSPRYLISIHIMLIILCAFYMDFVTKKMPVVTALISVLLAGSLLHSSYYLRLNGDYDLGYVYALKLQKQAVDFCEKNNLFDKVIYSGFLIRENMTCKSAGFLTDKPFTKFVSSPNDNPEYLIFSNIEWDPNYDKVKDNKSDTLLQHYDESWMWMEIYKRK